jgi:hypothetical protein
MSIVTAPLHFTSETQAKAFAEQHDAVAMQFAEGWHVVPKAATASRSYSGTYMKLTDWLRGGGKTQHVDLT